MPVRALVVGSLVMDLSFTVPKRPEPGEVIIAESFGAYRGGKGYNQAVALARLGAEVTMIGAVGRDAWGDEFLRSLTDEGVDATHVVRVDAIHTSVAVPIVTLDGDVGFVHSPGANAELSPEHCANPPACDMLLLQGEIPVDTSLTVARAVIARGDRVFLNPAPVHHITPELLDIADIIAPNEIEARALLGKPGDAADLVELASRLSAGRRMAVVTLGARGAAWAHEGHTDVVAPPRIKAVDATGAGDSFCAALALAVMEGMTLPEATRFACAAGAHAASVRGAEPGLPTRSQVQALLSSGDKR